MRILLFILLAVLSGSCSTTKEYDCDYSDYKTISLDDFEWVRDFSAPGSIEIINDTINYSYTFLDLVSSEYEKVIFKIDILNGDFINSTLTKERMRSNISRFKIEDLPDGWKYIVKTPQVSCIDQIDVIVKTKITYSHFPRLEKIKIEIQKKDLNPQLDKKKLKFKLNENKICGLYDFALYKECYIIISFTVFRENDDTNVYKLGLLDLQKLIDKY